MSVVENNSGSSDQGSFNEKHPEVVKSHVTIEDDDEREIRDQAYAILKDHIEDPIPAEANKSVLRKIDWRMMPLITFMYGINYVDKSCLSWAVMFNLEEDTHINGSQYSWVASIFYFGYLAAEYPANIIVHKLPTAKILFICTLAWGVLMLAHIGCNNFAGLMVVRFLLGVSEAPISSCCTILLSSWYKKKEQPMRFLCFNSGQGGCNVLFSFVTYGLGHAGGALKPWKYIYIVLSMCSFLLSVAFWFLPSLPSEASWLSQEEKIIAAKRVAENMMGVKNTQWKNYQVWHAVKDIKTWLIVLCMFFAMIPNGGLTNFNTLVISSFHFDHFQTILVGLPSSFFSAGQMWFWVYAGKYFKNLRTWGLTLPMCIAIIGISIVYGTENSNANKWGRVFAYWMINSYAVQFPFVLNMMGQNVSGHTKRTFTNACVLIAFAVANIIGPFCFKSSDAPLYTHALATLLGCFAACIVLGLLLGLVIIRENRRRDKKYGKPEEVDDIRLQGIIEGLKDKTDLENKNFRYAY